MLLERPFIIGVQSLNEFAVVCRRKLEMRWDDVNRALMAILGLSGEEPIPLTYDVHRKGILLAERYKLPLYDALLLAAAMERDCTTFWSEDLHNGLIIDSRLTVRNPFI